MDLDELRAAVGPDFVCISPCYRRPDVELAYQRHKRAVLEECASMEDGILRSVFLCGVTQDALGKFHALQAEAHPWAFVLNAFPYDIAEGLEHWLLWRSSEDQDMKGAAQHIRKNFGPQAVWFVNARANQTVPGLFHCHIFVRNTQK
jgi:hypothetical protein